MGQFTARRFIVAHRRGYPLAWARLTYAPALRRKGARPAGHIGARGRRKGAARQSPGHRSIER